MEALAGKKAKLTTAQISIQVLSVVFQLAT